MLDRTNITERTFGCGVKDPQAGAGSKAKGSFPASKVKTPVSPKDNSLRPDQEDSMGSRKHDSRKQQPNVEQLQDKTRWTRRVLGVVESPYGRVTAAVWFDEIGGIQRRELTIDPDVMASEEDLAAQLVANALTRGDIR